MVENLNISLVNTYCWAHFNCICPEKLMFMKRYIKDFRCLKSIWHQTIYWKFSCSWRETIELRRNVRWEDYHAPIKFHALSKWCSWVYLNWVTLTIMALFFGNYCEVLDKNLRYVNSQINYWISYCWSARKKNQRLPCGELYCCVKMIPFSIVATVGSAAIIGWTVTLLYGPPSTITCDSVYSWCKVYITSQEWTLNAITIIAEMTNNVRWPSSDSSISISCVSAGFMIISKTTNIAPIMVKLCSTKNGTKKCGLLCYTNEIAD